ncbi:MAG: galactose mutarotase [Actinomycetia bacterium]|nr:galactose mutarotase [Actinomycetes bacterium]
MSALTSSIFGVLPDGREVRSWILRGPGRLELEVLAYGARIHRILAPDREGRAGDVVLGRVDLAGYLGADYQGACIGRFANRLGNALLRIGETSYQLDRNDGPHSLHGGPQGFHQVMFEAVDEQGGDEPSLTLEYVSPDGESKFPGTMHVRLRYALRAPATLEISYQAVCDQACVFNPTNHAFFNLSGSVGATDVLDTVLEIPASQLTICNDDLIPTGALASVDAGTGAFDFRTPKPLGRDLYADERLLKKCGGYDQNYCVDGEGFRMHARASDPGSGRSMEVWSDLPGVQLYTFNFGDRERPGKLGAFYGPQSAFCLETQFWPDAPNQAHFPPCTLRPGVTFTTRTEYRFSAAPR